MTQIRRGDGRVRNAIRPQLVSRLLTIAEACNLYPGVHPKLIYLWAEEGRLHPVQPNGRVLYPEWEVRALYAAWVKNGETVKGGQLTFAELEAAA